MEVGSSEPPDADRTVDNTTAVAAAAAAVETGKTHEARTEKVTAVEVKERRAANWGLRRDREFEEMKEGKLGNRRKHNWRRRW